MHCNSEKIQIFCKSKRSESRQLTTLDALRKRDQGQTVKVNTISMFSVRCTNLQGFVASANDSIYLCVDRQYDSHQVIPYSRDLQLSYYDYCLFNTVLLVINFENAQKTKLTVSLLDLKTMRPRPFPSKTAQDEKYCLHGLSDFRFFSSANSDFKTALLLGEQDTYILKENLNNLEEPIKFESYAQNYRYLFEDKMKVVSMDNLGELIKFSFKND